GPDFLRYTLAFFWLLAFSSATHDIAADGFYMLGLSTHDQAWFVGVRSTFYRIAMITGQGLLIILAGYLESSTGLDPIELQVRATTSSPAAIELDAALNDSTLIRDDGVLRLIAEPAVLEISATPRTRVEIDSILSAVRAHNTGMEFYVAEESDNQSVEPAQPSLWNRIVSGPLERVLRRMFAEQEERPSRPDLAGNMGVARVYLSGALPAADEVVVNLGLDAGDRSIQLVEGSRLAFRPSNEDEVALVAFQLDPKLDAATDASFVGRSGNIPFAWSITFYVLAGFFVVAFLYHKLVLPFPTQDVAAVQEAGAGLMSNFLETFSSFFKKEGIGTAIAFLLLFRFAEAQLVKLASPFLLDTREVGGLALTTGEVGFVYGTVGVLALTVGGLLGGFLAARNGLRYWLWPMVVAINIPNAVYVFLSFATPESLLTVNICVAIEQFGYGFGFTAYLLYMIYIADGPHKTAHYAICTGFMALGMMIPGMFSGWLQEIVGYPKFFVWILIATIPAFVASALIKIDPSFGKKVDEAGDSADGSSDESNERR
ncbi:MAG: hypothetical protein R3178_07950, partial [Rhodothermales bacterium]|nr:hypothetical protein [Rhodothermales bacterium]